MLWPVVAAMAPGIVLGSLIGPQIASALPTRAFAAVFGAFVWFSATRIFIGTKPVPGRELPGKPATVRRGRGHRDRVEPARRRRRVHLDSVSRPAQRQDPQCRGHRCGAGPADRRRRHRRVHSRRVCANPTCRPGRPGTFICRRWPRSSRRACCRRPPVRSLRIAGPRRSCGARSRRCCMRSAATCCGRRSAVDVDSPRALRGARPTRLAVIRSGVAGLDGVLDAPIGNEPHQRDQHVDRLRDPAATRTPAGSRSRRARATACPSSRCPIALRQQRIVPFRRDDHAAAASSRRSPPSAARRRTAPSARRRNGSRPSTPSRTETATARTAGAGWPTAPGPSRARVACSM